MRPVVFVMSDVVGSTALWETHGDSMRAALEAHDGLVRGAIEAAGGRVFKHTGDGMIAVFADVDADRAVAGAMDVVDALAGGEWDDTGPLEVRVSVHAGAASERDGDFFGSPVNKVARINGVGHPSQVLVSDVARQLMSTPTGVDLGMHQLRDLSDPVRLWQLSNGEHPPLRTLKKARHNLPVMSSEFIGRTAEVDELRSLVGRHRLVTVTGVGGCGKTRLAVEVGAELSVRFPGGVWFVDLTTERDGANVGARALGALGLFEASSGVGGPVDILNEATAGSATLLIVDNCEHLIDDVADFAEAVLAQAPSVTVMATSREALSVDGEHVWRIPNLHDAAVELFIDRATAAGVTGLEDHLERIEEVCGQLDDIPLAIELAAARVSSLSIDGLAGRLDDRFSLLGGGRGRRRQRQQTLQSMMDWSYGLLTADEQTVLNHLSVFAGTFPLAGAESVAAPADTSVLDAINSLVEQSLVVPSVDSGRYRLLETVRLYALDRLMHTDQLAAARERHLTWTDELFGRKRSLSARDDEWWGLEEQRFADVDNAIAGMEWAEQTDNQDVLLSLFSGSSAVWAATGSLPMTWLDRVPEPPADRPDLRAEWLQSAGHCRYSAGDITHGFAQSLEAAALLDELTETDSQLSAALNAYQWPVCLLYRSALRAASSEYEAALVDCDRLLELQIDGNARFAEYASMQGRANVLAFQRDPAALGLCLEAAQIARTITRSLNDVSLSGAAQQLANADRFDEALTVALPCLDSPVVPQRIRISVVPAAAKSLAGLGRHEEALQIVEADFGPMIDAQKQSLRAHQLTALALILHQLDHLERFDQVASLAISQQSALDGPSAGSPLARVVGGDDTLAALPAPTAADLAPVRIDALIAEVIAEIRNHTGTAAP